MNGCLAQVFRPAYSAGKWHSLSSLSTCYLSCFAENVVAAFVGEDTPNPELTPRRPVPQHERLEAKVLGVIEGVGDELVRGSIFAVS